MRRPGREEQLVVVSAGKGRCDRIASTPLVPPSSALAERKRARIERDADLRRGRDLAYGIGQPVAQVHAARGGAIAAEQQAGPHTRLGTQVPIDARVVRIARTFRWLLLQIPETDRRVAERSRHVHLVAWIARRRG